MSVSASSSIVKTTCARPHSKTTVTGHSVKTRLHCNHLRPKCKCSSSQRKSNTAKHTVQGISVGHRRVLASSRVLPRGETNGRKIYHSTDDSTSVSDNRWRHSDSNSDQPKTSTDSHKSRDVDGKVIKKKLRFEDQVTEFEERRNFGQARKSGKEVNKSQIEEGQNLPSSNSSAHSRFDIGGESERNNQATSRDYCRLCEKARKEYSCDCYRKRRKDEVLTDARCSLGLNDTPSRDNHDICFLCHQNEHCRGCDNYCRICDRNIDSYGSQEDLSGNNEAQSQRNAASRHVTENDEARHSSSAGIPYRPRTTFVKDLKQRLETSYRKDDSVLRRGDAVTHEVLGKTESNRGGIKKYHYDRQDMHPGRKCMHRYQQNDRLFLEPTLTDREGRSLCSECGAAQPSDPKKDPYLYHITLGSMKPSRENIRSSSRSHSSHRGKENGATVSPNRPRKSYDPSKLAYAKLNERIDDLFWRKGLHSTHTRFLPPKMIPGSPHIKRHPSRSMALVDHLI